MKKYLSLLILLVISNIITAQEFGLGFDLFNRYVWRGLDLGGKSPNIQPWANVKFGNDNHSLTLGTWGAFSFAGTANDETDIYLNYSYKSCLNLLVTDYYFPGLNSGIKENYFEWRPDSTGHVLEGTFSFTGTEKIPLTALFAMNFYGNDARKSNGDLFMSKYAEIGFKKNIKGTDFNLFVGAALDNPDENAGEVGFYLNEKSGITNIGIKLTKSIEITDKFSLPVQCNLITNPQLKKIYFTLGISL